MLVLGAGKVGSVVWWFFASRYIARSDEEGRGCGTRAGQGGGAECDG